MESINRKVTSESEIGKIDYGKVWENADGNDTVLISVWRDEDMRLVTSVVLSLAVFRPIYVMKWSMRL